MTTKQSGLLSHYVVAALAGCVSLMFGAAAAEPFPINDGDRIVMVGATFVERDVRYGCIETLMTAHFHDYELTFRNLGWSGDNVFGIARASFDPIPKGYERLINQIKDAAPNVILFSYGQNESFKGAGGLDGFISGYEKLLDDIADLDARIVLVSPALQHDMGPPLPDPSVHNKDILLYTKAIAELASKREHHFVDMTTALSFSPERPLTHWTDNGVHFTEAAYWKVAETLLDELGYGAQTLDTKELVRIQNVVNEKNRLFFNKWRPQNATYITGFRKHEQGRHVEEFPLFDPLVVEQEKKITELRTALSKERAGQ